MSASCFVSSTHMDNIVAWIVDSNIAHNVMQSIHSSATQRTLPSFSTRTSTLIHGNTCSRNRTLYWPQVGERHECPCTCQSKNYWDGLTEYGRAFYPIIAQHFRCGILLNVVSISSKVSTFNGSNRRMCTEKRHCLKALYNPFLLLPQVGCVVFLDTLYLYLTETY